MRRQANLLLSHNHLHAFDYSLGRLYDESNMVVERENSRIITEADLQQLAVAGILSKEARSAFTKRLKELGVETRPIEGLFGPV